jgi:hypothetical protein
MELSLSTTWSHMGFRWRWLVSFTPRSLYPVERDFGSLPLVGCRAGLEAVEEILSSLPIIGASDSVSLQDCTASNGRSINDQWIEKSAEKNKRSSNLICFNGIYWGYLRKVINKPCPGSDSCPSTTKSPSEALSCGKISRCRAAIAQSV